MWLTFARILATTAGAIIALRIALLILLKLRRERSGSSERPADVAPSKASFDFASARRPSPPTRRQGVDRLLHWGFYLCMAAAVAAYAVHVRGG